METFRNSMGVASVVVAAFAVVPYILSILRRQTIPHQFSWLVFAIMGWIVAISQLLEGGRASVYISFFFAVSMTVEFVLSLFYGARNTSAYDKLLLGLSLGTIVVWIITRNSALAIYLTLLIDIFATTMVLLKIRRLPNTEAFMPWVVSTASFVFSCLALTGLSPGVLYVRPIYGLVSSGAVAVGIWYWRGHRPAHLNKQSSFIEDIDPDNMEIGT